MQSKERHSRERREEREATMRGRIGGGGGGGNGGGPPTDLLVCFPARAHHLSLMPKPLCSPSRTSDAGKRYPGKSGSSHRGQASPLFKAKDKHADIPEPTSPKVTCAGQIKVSRPKPRPAAGRDKMNWIEMVEEIEKFHNKEKIKPPRNWMEALGFKKEAMQFLGALRGFRFNMQCFGSFHGSSIDCSTDEDEEEDNHGDDGEEEEEADETSSKAIFSKWFMVLEENQDDPGLIEKQAAEAEAEADKDNEEVSAGPPPANALLLMRCRSAPAKGWLEEEGAGGEEEVSAKMIREEEKEKERMVLMSYAPDFFKVSTDIAKETWVVGSLDPLARSRSWRR